MKRIVVSLFTIICTVVFMSASGCIAEQTIDLTAMTSEELLDLQKALTAEMLSRPDFEDVLFVPGDYVVGVDIQAGEYYAIYGGGTWTGGSVDVYADSTKEKHLYSNDLSSSTYDVCKLTLEEGNVLSIDNNSVKINMVGFEKKPEPTGTEIPSGVYTVGDEIPAGKYTAYFFGTETVRINPESVKLSSRNTSTSHSHSCA